MAFVAWLSGLHVKGEILTRGCRHRFQGDAQTRHLDGYRFLERIGRYYSSNRDIDRFV